MKSSKLTAYSPGSLKECTVISVPLMFAALSSALMLFLDRLVLAHYSLEAMNGSASAIVIFNIFEFAVFAIAGMSEVFVGQYYGAKQFDRIAEPVWQMLIFSALSASLFWPIGIFATSWLIPEEFYADGAPYFQWLCYFGPIFSAVIALTGFYIGRGKVLFVTFLMLLGNLVNFILNIILVFGIKDVIAPMGSAGSAIASGISQSLIAILLAIEFLNHKHAKNYQTRRFFFSAETFWGCVHLGWPSAVGHFIAFSAWAFWMHLLADISIVHMTIMSICLSVWSLMYFATDGIQKGVTAIAANYLGANQPKTIDPLLKSAVTLFAIVSLVSAIPLLLFPQHLILLFLDEVPLGIDLSYLYEITRDAFRWLWICLFFDGITWIFAGLFTAAKNTRFIMFMEIIGAWFYCYLPSAWLIRHYPDLPLLPIQLMTIYTCLMAVSFLLRYQQKKKYLQSQVFL